MKRLSTVIIASIIYAISMAIPAKPGFVDYVQPDGSVIKIRIVGDEHGHVIYSEDGRLLTDIDGYLKYGDEAERMIESVLANRNARLANRVSRFDKRMMNTRTGISEMESGDRMVPQNYGRCDVTYPAIGEQKGLVILVAFSDIGFKYGDHDYFNRMLNEEGFSKYGSLGSARDWFIYNSGGLFSPEFDVYGPVTLPNTRAYYGVNDAYGNDKRPHEMVIDACNRLDEEIDFSEYDRDGDGIIDNVFIFYADIGEHDSGLKEAIWPHSWDISTASPGKAYIYDGVKLDHYACTCEYPKGYNRPDGIGTFVHEFSHVLGLPDLYVTDYGDGFTPGKWSVLDQGPYNNHGLTPPNYSSFEKSALGWLDFSALKEGWNELPELSDSNVAYALATEDKDEFYFFENRQQWGNDKFLPSHGMLVWHVDYDRGVWNLNEVNNRENHQRVDLIEADDMRTDGTVAGDPFPGSGNVTSFGFATQPQLASWAGKKLAFDIDNITETNDGFVRFNAVAAEGNGIESAGADEAREEVYYDLTGRRVLNPGKGIYILNGQKILIR